MATRLMASRLLAAVILANLLTLSVCSAVHAPVRALLVWPLAAAAIFCWLRPRFIRRPATELPRAAFVLAGLFFVLLSVPRLPYLLEWIPGNAVLAQADDYGRLAELVSLTLSPYFPPLHPSNQSYLLSHYFAALLPMAWLKLAVPPLTLKDCILLGNAFYHALMIMSLLEVAAHTLPSPRRALSFLFLMTFFSGFDWMMDLRLPFSHSEHWPRAAFGVLREISSFFTAHYWVVHHMAALYALLLAFVLALRCRFPTPRRRNLVVGALVLAAPVHSPFVFLGAMACFLPELVRTARRAWHDRTLPLLAAIALPVAPYFLGRLESRSLWWHPAPLLYLPAAIFVELAALPLLLAAAWPHLSPAQRRAATGGAVFLVLTWPFESVGYNNFAMRGLLVPCLALFWLCARHARLPLPKAAIALMVVLTSWGTLREAAWLTYQPLQFSVWYWRMRGKPVYPSKANPAYARLARDPSARYYQPGPEDRSGLDKFNAEKLVAGIPPEEMDEAERELARRSLWGW